MHINLSRWKPKYLLGQAMTIQMASWALREEREEKLEREREWLLTAKSINWMSGQFLRGLSCTALIKQSGHYVLNGQKKSI